MRDLDADGYETGFVDGYERGFALYGVGVIPSSRLEVALAEGKKQGQVNAEQAFRGAVSKAGPRTRMSTETAEALYACAYGGGYASGSERGFADASSERYIPRAVMRMVFKDGERRGRERAKDIFRAA